MSLPPAARPVQVLVVDDHPVFRRGLVGLLVDEAWVASVAEAATATDALREVVRERADVVVLDLQLPDASGLDVLPDLLAARPACRVLILTMTDDAEVVGRALQRGARGYALKRTEPEDLIAAVRAVARGSLVLGPEVALAPARPTELPPPLNGLTERELTLLRLVARGWSNADIARRLGVAEKTVRNQLTPAFDKVGVRDRVQAALLMRASDEPGGHPG